MPAAAVTTDRQISALKPLERVYEVAIGGSRGLYVRIFPTGTRNFELRYTAISGARRRLGLGSWPELTLAQARIRAGENRVAVQDGSDPAAERTQRRIEARTGETFDELAEAYWRAAVRGLHGGRRRPKRASTIETERRLWDKHVAPKLGHRLYRDLKRRDIRLFMNDLTDTSGLAPASLAAVGAVIQSVLQYAVLEEKIESNPALGQARPLALTSRDRLFSDESLNVIWRAVESAATSKPVGPLTGEPFNAISPTTGLALQFLLLTLARRSEVAGARWNEFDLRAGIWVIPASRAKAQHIHVVPLTARMMEILRTARERNPGTAAVFPACRGAGEAMEPRVLTRAVARICERFGLPPGSPHDFRRSGATTLIGRYHVNRMLAGLLLGHTIREGAAATSVYDRYGYLPEKHRALEIWGDHLVGLDTAPQKEPLSLSWFGATAEARPASRR